MIRKETRALARERGLRPARPGRAELQRTIELQGGFGLCCHFGNHVCRLSNDNF